MTRLRNILRGIAKSIVSIAVLFAFYWISHHVPAPVRTLFKDFYKGLGVLLLALGAILLITAAFWLKRNRFFLRSAKTVQGIVVDNLPEVGSDATTTYFPQFSFTTISGQKIVVKSNVGSSPASYTQGESISVLYDPSDPWQAKIKGDTGLGCGVVVLIWGAIIFLFNGLLLLMIGS